MADLGELWITIKANTSRLAADIQRDAARAGEQAGDGAGKGFGQKFGTAVAGIGAGVAVGTFLKDASTAASDLNETMSKTINVFGSSGDAMVAWSENSATAFGLSQQEALAAASGFGSLFVGLGQTEGAAAKNSQAMVDLAADLGSFNNLPTAEVVDMMSSAFRGEYDSIQRVLPLINGASVEQKALAMTGKESAKALTEQEKAAAVMALATEGATLAQDDFAETSDGVANKQKIVNAQWEDFQAVVGGPVNAVVSVVLGLFGDMIGVLTGVATWVGQAWAWMVKFQTPIKVVAGVIGALLLPALVTMGVQAAISFAVMVAGWVATAAAAVVNGAVTLAMYTALGLAAVRSLAQAMLGFLGMVAGWAMSAVAAMASAVIMAAAWLIALGPVGWVIAAILAVVAVFVVLWHKMDGFKEFWLNLWDTITEALGKAWEWMKSATQAFVDWIVRAWQGFLAFMSGIWSAIVNAAKAAWDWVKGIVAAVVDAITAVIRAYLSVVVGVWTAIRDAAVAAWNWIKGIVSGVVDAIRGFVTGLRDTINGIWTAIKDKAAEVWDAIAGKVSAVVDEVIGFVKALPGKIKDALSGAADWLVSAGKDAIRGLWNGIQSMGAWIKDKVLGFVKDMLPGPVKKALGIGSPSKVFADIGEDVVLGLRKGIGAERGHLLADMGALVPTSTPGWGGGPAGSSGGLQVAVYIGDERLEARVVRVTERAATEQAGRLVSAGVS